MRRTFLLKSMLLLCALVGGSSSVWGQVTLWSEDFSGYSADDVPSGGTYSYACTNGTYTSKGTTKTAYTKIYNEASTGGGESPELLVARTSGGSFTATIPLDNMEGTLTLTYYQNAQKLKVSSTTTGVSGGQELKPSSAGQQTTTFTGITKDMTSITIKFETTTSNNVRLDNIVLTGYKASGVTAPTIDIPGGFYTTTQNVTITTNEEGGTTYYTIDGSTPTDESTPYTGAISISTTTTLKAITYKSGKASSVVSATYNFIEDGIFNFNLGANYGSEMTQGSDIIENQSATWTAGNVTLVVANRYLWNTNGKMVIYKKAGSADAAGSITISCPSEKVITQIDITGPYSGTGALSNITADKGNYTVTSSSAIWTGVAQSVTFTNLSDGSAYLSTITVTYGDKETTEVQSYGWASYITPSAVKFEANTAYVVTDASVSAGLTLEAITEAPAGTPLLLKGAGEKTIAVVASATAPTTNLLTVCDGTIASGKYPYVLAKNGTSAAFKQWTGEASVLNGRVVLLLNEAVASSSPVFSLDGNTTGISSIENGQMTIDNSEVYNLNGQRVAQPTKGLYIVNGRKVVIK